MAEINYRKCINLAPIFSWYRNLAGEENRWADWYVDEKRVALVECKARVNTALDYAQRRCTARTINAYDIYKSLTEVEEKMDGVPAKDLEGTVVWIDPNAQHFPSAYRYIPESTHFYAAFHRGSWWLVYVYRDNCKAPTKKHRLELSETAKDALIRSRTTW